MARPDMISCSEQVFQKKRYQEANAVTQICVRFSFLFFTAGLVVLLFAVPILAAKSLSPGIPTLKSDLAGYRIYYETPQKLYHVY